MESKAQRRVDLNLEFEDMFADILDDFSEHYRHIPQTNLYRAIVKTIRDFLQEGFQDELYGWIEEELRVVFGNTEAQLRKNWS